MIVLARLLLVTCLVASTSAVARAADGQPTVFRLDVSVSAAFGETAYEMNALTPDPRGSGDLIPIRSRLEFPLDTTLLGVSAAWRLGIGDSRRWILTAEFRTDVTDPSAMMTDNDFFAEKQIFFGESDPEIDRVLAALDVAYRLRQTDRTTIDALFRLDYERLEQHIVGFEGWQGSLFSDFRADISDTRPSLDYEVTFMSLQIGGAVETRLRSSTRIDLRSTVGILFASDTDDHLLRSRLAEGHGIGVAVNTRLGVDLLRGLLPVSSLSVRLEGDFRFLYADGQVDQRWYDGSDRKILDLPYEFESLQTGIGIAIGYEL